MVGSVCGYVGDLCPEGYVISRVLQFPLAPLSLSQMSTFLNLPDPADENHPEKMLLKIPFLCIWF